MPAGSTLGTALKPKRSASRARISGTRAGKSSILFLREGIVTGNTLSRLEQILVKSAGFHFALEVPVRCGNDSRVDRHRPLGTDSGELPRIQEGEQFRLNGQGKLSDLVQSSVPPSANSTSPACDLWNP